MINLSLEPEFIKEKMGELFEDIKILLSTELNNKEVFYYASHIHLKFVVETHKKSLKEKNQNLNS